MTIKDDFCGVKGKNFGWKLFHRIYRRKIYHLFVFFVLIFKNKEMGSGNTQYRRVLFKISVLEWVTHRLLKVVCHHIVLSGSFWLIGMGFERSKDVFILTLNKSTKAMSIFLQKQKIWCVTESLGSEMINVFSLMFWPEIFWIWKHDNSFKKIIQKIVLLKHSTLILCLMFEQLTI